MRQIDDTVFFAEGSRVIQDVVIGADSSVWYNAVVRGIPEQVVIGKQTNIQDNAVLHCDPGRPLQIGDGVTIGHAAIVHGCTVGDNTLIGMGAIILDDAVIGRDCIIGAGTLITQRKKIPDGSLVYGNPARIIRELSPEEIESNRHNAAHYVEMSRQMKKQQG